LKRLFLSGNEAIARGALEAGVSLVTGYPGTPSTEILEQYARMGGANPMWAPNEKIAVEMASGASFAGFRTLAAMKHVGINVAADPVFTLAYTGVRGGLVIVTADDPELHSSQNEQDNRRYAHFARIPMLEPSDSREALEFTREAFKLSEDFDLPFFIRTTTRTSHGKSIVPDDVLKSETGEVEPGLVKDPSKYVMVPSNARPKHVELEDRVSRVAEFAESCSFNRIEMAGTALGVVTSGISYNYVKEALPDASVLKLGMVFPLPSGLLSEFASSVDRLVVVEELEPYLEEWIRIEGFEVEGKSLIPRFGEIDTGVVRDAVLAGKQPVREAPADDQEVPQRPPVMCIGCPHRGIFYLLSKKKTFVAGDIGCYTLAVTPPLSAIHTTVCMGAGINQAAGMEVVLPEEHGKVLSVIGDSTFLHTGMGGVFNMTCNNIPATVLILDNYTTAMTGRQNHPGSGFDVHGNRTKKIDWEKLLRGLGVEHLQMVDAYDLDEIESALNEEINRDAPSVIVVQGACMLLRNQPVKIENPYAIDEEACTDCGMCLKLGCPAISRKNASPDETPVISAADCTGCSHCFQVCSFDAIQEIE